MKRAKTLLKLTVIYSNGKKLFLRLWQGTKISFLNRELYSRTLSRDLNDKVIVERTHLPYNTKNWSYKNMQ
jgi:hypothetical protein